MKFPKVENYMHTTDTGDDDEDERIGGGADLPSMGELEQGLVAP